MDSWWESLDRAFGAWSDAIAAAGLTWKYRQVEEGEWSLIGDEDKEKGGETPSLSTNLDRPLPWDHIDTGISKDWLKADLQRGFSALDS